MKLQDKVRLCVVTVAVSSFVLFVGACNNQPTTPEASINAVESTGQTQEQVIDLLVPVEDLTKFESNSPIWRTIANDELVDDLESPLFADPASISDDFFEIYSVRVVWGKLRDGVGSSSLSLNWSGGMTHNSAAMMVLRSLIDFEHGQDSAFRRDDMPGIFWKSQTGGDDAFDGVHVQLYHPKDVVYIVAPHLNIKAGPVELRIPFGELVDLDTVISVSDGVAVSIQAHLVRTRDCPSGYLAGTWVHKSRTAGHFFGKWIASDGQPMGYLRGEFGTTDDGSRWLKGKWFSRGGDFQGHLKGDWGFNDDSDPHPCLACDWRIGWFRGRFSDAAGNDRGRLRGRFGKHGAGDVISDSDGAGLFFGKWTVDCPNSGSN